MVARQHSGASLSSVSAAVRRRKEEVGGGETAGTFVGDGEEIAGGGETEGSSDRFGRRERGCCVEDVGEVRAVGAVTPVAQAVLEEEGNATGGFPDVIGALCECVEYVSE